MDIRAPHPKKRAAICIICLIVIAATVCVFWYIRDQSTSKPSSSRYWIMSDTVLNDMTASTSARSTLANDTLYVLTRSSSALNIQQDHGLHIIQTEDFTSEATLASALRNKTIVPGTEALLYDNEQWSLTPTNEQKDPLTYYKKAATLAHSDGYILIATPGRDSDLRQIAPYVDVVDIQSQEDQASGYASHVLPIARAVRQASKHVIILSGLSTNPSVGIPTSSQLVSDAKSVTSTVQGYWLNIPSPGTACPRCNQPQPQLGIAFLSSLGPL